MGRLHSLFTWQLMMYQKFYLVTKVASGQVREISRRFSLELVGQMLSKNLKCALPRSIRLRRGFALSSLKNKNSTQHGITRSNSLEKLLNLSDIFVLVKHKWEDIEWIPKAISHDH